MAAVKWTIGVDPGFGETGLVLRRGTEVTAWATLSCPPNGSAYLRTSALAFRVCDIMMEWVAKYKIQRLDVAIETPIYNANPHSFELQWRLLHDIESNTTLLAVEDLWLTEVGPSTSKKLATGSGSASKIKIIYASPFADVLIKETTGIQPHTLETLADAWAHSLAAWQGCPDCTRISLNTIDSDLPDVKEICYGET